MRNFLNGTVKTGQGACAMTSYVIEPGMCVAMRALIPCTESHNYEIDFVIGGGFHDRASIAAPWLDLRSCS
jgi:hypothetical protein